MTAWMDDRGSAWTVRTGRGCSGHGCTTAGVAERFVFVSAMVRSSTSTTRVVHTTRPHGRVYAYCGEHLARLGRRVHNGRIQVAVPDTLGRTA